MNGKRAKRKENSLHVAKSSTAFFIEERVGESDKAFHDFTTCGRLSYRIKSTRVWETNQENKRASKHGEEFINLTFAKQSAAGGGRNSKEVLETGGGRSLRSLRSLRSGMAEQGKAAVNWHILAYPSVS